MTALALPVTLKQHIGDFGCVAIPPDTVKFRIVTPAIGTAPPVMSPTWMLAGPEALMSSNTKSLKTLTTLLFLLSLLYAWLTWKRNGACGFMLQTVPCAGVSRLVGVPVAASYAARSSAVQLKSSRRKRTSFTYPPPPGL